ncbi:MAG: DDE-type integrase/transposase/recombinase [Pseudomonadota bacterium]
MSQRAACRAVSLFPDRGLGKDYKLIRRRRLGWNHKRVHRVYCALGLDRRRLGKKRLPPRDPKSLAVPAEANQSWSMDFMSDALWCGRRCRTFNVADDFNREVLAIEVDLYLPAVRVVRVLESIAAWRGYPARIRMDNGPAFIAGVLVDWAQQHGVALEFIQPGRPMQNGFIERLNRSYREAVLDM